MFPHCLLAEGAGLGGGRGHLLGACLGCLRKGVLLHAPSASAPWKLPC